MADRYISGIQPIKEAIKQDVVFEKVWIQRGLRGEAEKFIRSYCKEQSITLSYVPPPPLS